MAEASSLASAYIRNQMWINDSGDLIISANERGVTIKVNYSDGGWNVHKFVVINGKLVHFPTERKYEDWKTSCE